jgi:hypothetical protein
MRTISPIVVWEFTVLRAIVFTRLPHGGESLPCGFEFHATEEPDVASGGGAVSR